MIYQDYLNLGFGRIDTCDGVVFKETGYTGYILTKSINEKMKIEVCFQNLDDPKLYIQKKDGHQCHIIKISPEMLKDMF